MKKELIAYIETNEQDELIRVNRVDDGTNKFMLLSLGTNRMVVDIAELMEAIGAIGHYSTLFDQEQKMREARKNSPVRQGPMTEIHALPMDKKPAKKSKVAKEDEGALVLEAELRTGPTASELALEKQTQRMQGGSLVLRENK